MTGMALIHHNREALGQSFYGVFSPQQRRAAAFTFGKSANGSDYSSKNPHALSLQPVACAHLRVSIIWELEQVAGVVEAREFLHRATAFRRPRDGARRNRPRRFSGGRV